MSAQPLFNDLNRDFCSFCTPVVHVGGKSEMTRTEWALNQLRKPLGWLFGYNAIHYVTDKSDGAVYWTRLQGRPTILQRIAGLAAALWCGLALFVARILGFDDRPVLAIDKKVIDQPEDDTGKANKAAFETLMYSNHQDIWLNDLSKAIELHDADEIERLFTFGDAFYLPKDIDAFFTDIDDRLAALGSEQNERLQTLRQELVHCRQKLLNGYLKRATQMHEVNYNANGRFEPGRIQLIEDLLATQGGHAAQMTSAYLLNAAVPVDTYIRVANLTWGNSGFLTAFAAKAALDSVLSEIDGSPERFEQLSRIIKIMSCNEQLLAELQTYQIDITSEDSNLVQAMNDGAGDLVQFGLEERNIPLTDFLLNAGQIKLFESVKRNHSELPTLIRASNPAHIIQNILTFLEIEQPFNASSSADEHQEEKAFAFKRMLNSIDLNLRPDTAASFLSTLTGDVKQLCYRRAVENAVTHEDTQLLDCLLDPELAGGPYYLFENYSATSSDEVTHQDLIYRFHTNPALFQHWPLYENKLGESEQALFDQAKHDEASTSALCKLSAFQMAHLPSEALIEHIDRVEASVSLYKTLEEVLEIAQSLPEANRIVLDRLYNASAPNNMIPFSLQRNGIWSRIKQAVLELIPSQESELGLSSAQSSLLEYIVGQEDRFISSGVLTPETRTLSNMIHLLPILRAKMTGDRDNNFFDAHTPFPNQPIAALFEEKGLPKLLIPARGDTHLLELFTQPTQHARCSTELAVQQISNCTHPLDITYLGIVFETIDEEHTHSEYAPEMLQALRAKYLEMLSLNGANFDQNVAAQLFNHETLAASRFESPEFARAVRSVFFEDRSALSYVVTCHEAVFMHLLAQGQLNSDNLNAILEYNIDADSVLTAPTHQASQETFVDAIVGCETLSDSAFNNLIENLSHYESLSSLLVAYAAKPSMGSADNTQQRFASVFNRMHELNMPMHTLMTPIRVRYPVDDDSLEADINPLCTLITKGRTEMFELIARSNTIVFPALPALKTATGFSNNTILESTVTFLSEVHQLVEVSEEERAFQERVEHYFQNADANVTGALIADLLSQVASHERRHYYIEYLLQALQHAYPAQLAQALRTPNQQGLYPIHHAVLAGNAALFDQLVSVGDNPFRVGPFSTQEGTLRISAIDMASHLNRQVNAEQIPDFQHIISTYAFPYNTLSESAFNNVVQHLSDCGSLSDLLVMYAIQPNTGSADNTLERFTSVFNRMLELNLPMHALALPVRANFRLGDDLSVSVRNINPFCTMITNGRTQMFDLLDQNDISVLPGLPALKTDDGYSNTTISETVATYFSEIRSPSEEDHAFQERLEAYFHDATTDVAEAIADLLSQVALHEPREYYTEHLLKALFHAYPDELSLALNMANPRGQGQIYQALNAANDALRNVSTFLANNLVNELLPDFGRGLGAHNSQYALSNSPSEESSPYGELFPSDDESERQAVATAPADQEESGTSESEWATLNAFVTSLTQGDNGSAKACDQDAAASSVTPAARAVAASQEASESSALVDLFADNADMAAMAVFGAPRAFTPQRNARSHQASPKPKADGAGAQQDEHHDRPRSALN